MSDMMSFLVDNIWHILWALLALYFLALEILGVFDPRVKTLSAYVWLLVGHDHDNRWTLSWRKVAALAVLLALTSHLVFGLP